MNGLMVRKGDLSSTRLLNRYNYIILIFCYFLLTSKEIYLELNPVIKTFSIHQICQREDQNRRGHACGSSYGYRHRRGSRPEAVAVRCVVHGCHLS